jgi:hypothetical protein
LVLTVGLTTKDPLRGTDPTVGAIVTEVAPVVDQFSVADSPAMMLVGVA